MENDILFRMLEQYHGLLIDLFWTILDIDMEIMQGSNGLKAQDSLTKVAQKIVPGLNPKEFNDVFSDERKRIRQEWEAGIEEEVNSEKKFYQFIKKLSIAKKMDEDSLRNLAYQLTKHHMGLILKSTKIPEKRKKSLQQLSRSHPLVLVSNFDHGETGRKILQAHGLESLFQKIIISDEFGKRKPHPLLFESGLKFLDLQPRQVLMIGDSPLVDIHAANQLGIDTLWINRGGTPWPVDLISPTYEAKDLSEIFSLGTTM